MRWLDEFDGLSRSLAGSQSAAMWLFLITGALLVLTYRLVRQDWAEISAWGSLATVVVAIHFMVVSWHAVAGRQIAQAATRNDAWEDVKSFKDCPTCPEMVMIPAAVIEIGHAGNGAPSHLGPPRKVMIARRFAISRTAISPALFGQYETATGRIAPRCGDRPCRSLDDAQAFARWLSELGGKPYRLASAAEWEHAMRAGAVVRPVVAAAGAARNGFGVDVGLADEFVADCWTATLAGMPTDGRPAWCGSSFTRTGVVKGGGSAGAQDFSARRPVDMATPQSGVELRVVYDLPAKR